MRLLVLFISLLSLPLSNAFAISGDSFSISIGDTKIGEYVVERTPDGDGTSANGETVTSYIDVTYKIGPVVLFDFHQHTVEKWISGELVSLIATTTTRGKKKHLQITRRETGYDVNGVGFMGHLPLTALPSTYWNRRLVETATTMISTEDGNPIAITVARLQSRGDVERFSLKGDAPLVLEYVGEKLVGLQMKIRGRDIIYTLIGPSSY